MKLPRLTLKKSQESFFSQVLLLTLSFAYLFGLKFLKFEWMPATRLVLLICTLTVGLKLLYFFKKDIEKNIIFYLFQTSILFYVICQVILLPTDFGMLSRIIVFLVFTLYIAAAASMFFRDVDHFLKVLTICCSFQAFMVFVSFLSPTYREWLAGVMVEGGNIPFLNPFRVPGFSTGSGASLSLILSTGVFATMSLYWQARKFKYKLFYLFLSIFITVSCIVVGKLGLFLSFIYICLFFFMSSGNLKHTSLIILSFVIALLLVYSSLDIDWDAIAYPIERSFSIFLKGEDSTLGALTEMPIPPIEISTIIGTGLASTPSGYNASGSDIGYIQNYYGFGLIVATLFYGSLFYYLTSNIFRLLKSRSKVLCMIFFIPLFLIEFKEPFVTKVAYPIVLLILIFLSQKQQNELES